jgi:N-acyl-D-amino-acid deacylase
VFDVIISRGNIVDGTGKPGFQTDIGISGDRVAEIGDLSTFEATRRIDAAGKVVAPGFIDIHTHSDFTLLVNGRAESQVHQGVTSEVIGNCGHSCAPCADREKLKHLVFGYHPSIDISWTTFDEYLSRLEDVDLGVNVAAYVGHGTLRMAAMNGENRPAGEDEIAEMARLLDESLDGGAIGFSTGLEYAPGSSATTAEIAALCRVLKGYDRLHATHVRNRDIYYEQGFGEALATARNMGVGLQISHIIPKFGSPPHAMEHTLDLIRWSRESGADVAFDVIPFTWGPTTMSSILPPWAFDGGITRILERLADPDLRPRLKQLSSPIWQAIPAGRWDMIMLFQSRQNAASVGMTFEEIGRLRGTDPHDAVLDILLEEGEGLFAVTWAAENFTEADIRLALEQPECGVISDTITLAPYGEFEDTKWSPSTYGWSARFLERYVHAERLVPLEEAVRRITGLAAERLGLVDRGVLRAGAMADVVILDLAAVHDNSTLENPNQYPGGFEYVFVNGRAAIERGQRTTENAGRVLRAS